jgi:hypothetical protein
LAYGLEYWTCVQIVARSNCYPVGIILMLAVLSILQVFIIAIDISSLFFILFLGRICLSTDFVSVKFFGCNVTSKIRAVSILLTVYYEIYFTHNVLVCTWSAFMTHFKCIPSEILLRFVIRPKTKRGFHTAAPLICSVQKKAPTKVAYFSNAYYIVSGPGINLR